MTDPLFTPFTLKHLTLLNRIVSTSHEPAYGEDGLPKDRYRAYHREKARGGVALTMMGGSALVSPDSTPAFGNLQLFRDEAVPYLRALADDVHEQGAAVMTQLTHLGHRTLSFAGDWAPAISASGTREPAHRAFSRPAETLDIERIIRDFADTAVRCKEGGLDGVEIMAYNGHLLDEFLTPLRNHRDDEYGGSFENRMRFPLAVIDAVRAAVGEDFVIGIRMSFDEQRAGGIDPDEGIRMAREFSAHGVDVISAIRGYIDTDVDLAKIIPPMGTPASPHLEFAGWVKRHVDVPVMHAGRIADVATARYAISEGLLDLVGMTRALMADPNLPEKVRTGRADQVRPCVGANMCIDGIYGTGSAHCIHNPATGREQHLPQVVVPATTRKDCAVVGAGPAGLEAARVLAERGHRVTVYEANTSAGGQISLAARTPRRRDLIGIVDWRLDECKRLGVDLRFNHYADPDELRRTGVQVIILATGGLPDIDLPANHLGLAVDTWDVIGGAVKPTGDVLVYDDHGGHQSLDAIDALTATARAIEYVTPERTIAPDVGASPAAGYFQTLADADVRMTPLHQLIDISRRDGRLAVTLRVEDSHTERIRLVDTVVIEHGTVPDTSLYHCLAPHSKNLGQTNFSDLIAHRPQSTVHNPDADFVVHRIGDAVASRNIHAAVLDAYRLCSVI
ncbi:putative N-methylproline demethylase [Gordonia polyisoprenivorans VH2]|uniref:Putative N-methylproline demethylase n=1 Tax=Gordonia polyisoprenivorans (strain DSM 44266 / VH2) TaxID=1112204 RepID=H6MYM6_GORPV|nr:NADH:flavin oxidoreductase [Gordonia polyisoprenivorans]AFA71904.1 putative N-methylproline demethylase [Gordonia polyisoprenivorans VH2]WCB38281.1 NADH:flavin oxidoreductase [Gordonia polyisoprenivorans]